jgi:ApbE superfamily uncharacterized protein (UPF0280 family)
MAHSRFGVNQPRFYRLWVRGDELISFNAKVKETDLQIRASLDMRKEAADAIKKCRRPLEEFVRMNPEFERTLAPYPLKKRMPPIVREMALAAKRAGVGPMAAVAGAVAEYVGRELLKKSREVIVENGGDIFIKVKRPVRIGIYAADSPFTNKIAFEIRPQETPVGVCTSSGTVGPSLSFGRSDATIAIARTAAFADACATAIGNLIKDDFSIDRAIARAKKIRGLRGIVIIKGKKLGVWGKVRFVV